MMARVRSDATVSKARGRRGSGCYAQNKQDEIASPIHQALELDTEALLGEARLQSGQLGLDALPGAAGRSRARTCQGSRLVRGPGKSGPVRGMTRGNTHE
jgi:hypothetical protein